MGAAPDLIATGRHYTAIVLGSNVVVMLLFLNNAIFRGAGDASLAMRVLWMSNLINLVLDPCLIFGLGPFPELGITGAAVSTLIGRSAGVAFQFRMLANGRSRVRIRPRDFRIVPRCAHVACAGFVTGVLQFAIGHTSWIALVRMVSTFGSDAVAGYTIGIRIFIFAVLPSWGLSGAAATMVGQNLGARKPDRAVKAVYLTAIYNAMFLGAGIDRVCVHAGDAGTLFTSEAPVSHSLSTVCASSASAISLRLRDGDGAGVQRRRRYGHADDDQCGRVLALRDSDGVGFGLSRRSGGARCVSGDTDRARRDHDPRSNDVPAREVENAKDLICCLRESRQLQRLPFSCDWRLPGRMKFNPNHANPFDGR